MGQPILSGNGTVLFYEDEGGISAVECSISDLGLTAIISPTTVIAGKSQTQVWRVSNLDQAIASDVSVRATLPAGFQVTEIAPQGICSQTGQEIACTYKRLDMGASETVTATIAVGAGITGDQATTFAVSSASSADRDPANNTLTITTTVQAQADLQIAKSASPDTALRTEPITYTLVVYNDGPSVARQVQMTDSLPTALDFLSSDRCSVGGGALLCALGDMEPGAQITATVRTRVNANIFVEQDIVNRALVLSSQTSDPLPLNNRVAITNSINTKFDLAVTKTATPTPLLAGGPITYTIVVTNSGPSVADGVRLSDTLPAEILNLSTPTTTLGVCAEGLSFTCDFGALARDQVVTVTVSGMLSPTLSGVITNTALVFSQVEANADRQPSNDISVLVTPVERQADLLAEKFTTPAGPVVAGGTLTYTLGATNTGPSLADNVTLSDTLPAGVTITGLATSLGQCTGSTRIACQIGSLLPGERGTVTVTVRVNSTTAGVLTNTVSVQSTTQDPNVLNNNASVTTTVTDAANLVLSKTASVAVATAGQGIFFYTLVVGNHGPSTARSVFLTDTLPSDVTFVSSTPPAGATCSHAAGVVTCDLGSVTVGISQTVRLDVAVAAGATGSLTNTATVSTSALDPAGDNTATATISVGQLADLQVTKRAVIDNLNVGGTITYTVNVDNFGPSNATGVVISDLLPVGLIASAVTVSQGSYSQATSLWTVGSVAAGQQMTMTIAAAIGELTSGKVVTNTALLHALAQTDPVLFNNGQFVTFTVPLNADVAIAKSVTNPAPLVQGLVTFVLTATNNGPETATGVRVLDLLPAELSFVSVVASQGVYSATTGIWSVGALNNSGAATLSILAQVVGSGSFINTTTISATEYDDNLGDNQAAVTLSVDPRGRPAPGADRQLGYAQCGRYALFHDYTDQRRAGRGCRGRGAQPHLCRGS